MISAINGGFSHSVKSLRTLTAALAFGLVAYFRFAQSSSNQTANGWDALMPAVSDSLVIAILAVGWWLTWLVPMAYKRASEIEQIRFGSRTRTFSQSLASLAGSAAALGFLVAATSIGSISGNGFDWGWSANATISPLKSLPTAYSSQHFSQFFPNPVLAVVCVAVFAFLGMLSIASLTLAIAIVGHPLAASIAAVAIGAWIFISSFSPIAIPTFLDGSIIVGLGWALNAPNGVAVAVIWWIALWLAAWSITSSCLLKDSFSLFKASRWTSVAIGIALTLLSLIYDLNSRILEHLKISEIFFAGSFNDLVGYSLVAAIPLTISSAFYARLQGLREGLLPLVVFRHGSYRSWLGSTLATELSWAAVSLLSIGAVLYTTTWLTTGNLEPIGTDAIWQGCLGFFAEVCIQFALAISLFLRFPYSTSVWPSLAALLLVTGFWMPQGLWFINLAAPYSRRVGFLSSSIELSSTLVTFACATLLLLIALRYAKPSNLSSIS